MGPACAACGPDRSDRHRRSRLRQRCWVCACPQLWRVLDPGPSFIGPRDWTLIELQRHAEPGPQLIGLKNGPCVGASPIRRVTLSWSRIAHLSRTHPMVELVHRVYL